MKRMIMFAGILCVLFVTACAGGSPSSAARKFYAAVEKNDTNAMRDVATRETVELMAMYGDKAKGVLTANGKIKRTIEDIDEDTAVVTLIFENGEETELELVKIDGKWKVTIDK